MKLFGGKRGGRHLLKNAGKKSKSGDTAKDKSIASAEDASKPGSGKKRLSRKKIIIISSITGALLIGLVASAYFYLRYGGEAPQQRDAPRGPDLVWDFDPDDPDAPPIAVPVDTPDDIERDQSKYTFLITGTDATGNTDVIMVAAFDSDDYTLEVVSIPRDTLMNVSWNLKKANSIQSTMRQKYRGQDNAEELAMQDTIKHFADILGFEVDFWVTVNLRAFVSLIDAVGPIEFYVPVNMYYSDSAQNLYINYSKGTHRLNGKQALEILRFRAGYSNADIGRINTQQQFLTAAVKQILANKNSINVITLANVFLRDVRTDLQIGHLTWLGREFLKLNVENVNFTVLPGAIDWARGADYVTIFVDEWLEIVNSKLNPWSKEITAEDVSILTRGPDRKLYVTDGNWQGDSSWGASSLGPAPGTGSNTNTPGSTVNTPRPTEPPSTDPADPTDDPTDPVDPTDDPADPVDPTDPPGNTDPTEPVEAPAQDDSGGRQTPDNP